MNVAARWLPAEDFVAPIFTGQGQIDKLAIPVVRGVESYDRFKRQPTLLGVIRELRVSVQILNDFIDRAIHSRRRSRRCLPIFRRAIPFCS